MSYCKINIGGKERGLKFNNLAMIIMGEKTSKQYPNETAAYAMVFGGLVGNSYAKEEELDFTFEDVIGWVDNLTIEDSTKIAEAFQASEAYKKTEAYIQAAEESKKKEVKEKPTTVPSV